MISEKSKNDEEFILALKNEIEKLKKLKPTVETKVEYR